MSLAWPAAGARLAVAALAGAIGAMGVMGAAAPAATTAAVVTATTASAAATSVPDDSSKRMHIDSYVLLRRKGSKVEWDGKALRNLDGPVGYQRGYSVGDQLRKLNVEVDEGSQRADELARKLIAGRLGAAALGGSDAHSVMNSPAAAQLEMLPVPLAEKPYFLILSHGMVARRPELSQRIWAAME